MGKTFIQTTQRVLTDKKKSAILPSKWTWLVVIALTFTLLGDVARAQQPAKAWKIGVLVSTSQALDAARAEALRQGLREFGYEEGKNIEMEYKYAEGKMDRLAQLARELVDQKVDVIVVGGTSVAVAAKNATKTIPIVVAGAGDLVEAGLINSYVYPGGNVTGVGRLSADFFGDRLKLIKEILPKATQIAALSNPNNPGHGRSLKDAELGARSSGLSFQNAAARTANDLHDAIAGAAKGGANALFILSDAMFNSQVGPIAQAAIKNRLPSVYDRTTFVDAGGLMSYGVNLADLSKRAAEYVHHLFKGAKPSDLTLVQPTKFDLSLNLKTADQIGVKVPPEVIARAAQELGCRSVAFTYNDPVIFHEYAIDVAQACRARGIKTVAVTAGYVCKEPRREFYRYIDAANVDLKAFTERFYQQITAGHLQPVLDTLVYLKHETKVWFEITTLLIPGENDSDQEIEALTQWVLEHLGPDVPVHFTAFHPDYKMLDKPPTPIESLIRARRIAVKNGIRYAYTGNVHDPEGDSTYCHGCGKKLIGRDWYLLSDWNLTDDGRCRSCGAACAGVFSGPPGKWGPKRLPVRLGDFY